MSDFTADSRRLRGRQGSLEMVFLVDVLSDKVPEGKVHARSPVANTMTKQRPTYDFLALLDASLDFWDITLRFIVDLIDLVFAENLESLSGR